MPFIYLRTGKRLCEYPGFERGYDKDPSIYSREQKDKEDVVSPLSTTIKDMNINKPSHQAPIQEAWWEGWKQESVDSPTFSPIESYSSHQSSPSGTHSGGLVGRMETGVSCFACSLKRYLPQQSSPPDEHSRGLVGRLETV